MTYPSTVAAALEGVVLDLRVRQGADERCALPVPVPAGWAPPNYRGM